MFEGSDVPNRPRGLLNELKLDRSTLTVMKETINHVVTFDDDGKPTIHYTTWVSVQTRNAAGNKTIGDIGKRLGLVLTDIHDASVTVPTRVGKFMLQGKATGLYKVLVITTRVSDFKVTLQFDGKEVDNVRDFWRTQAPISERHSSIQAIDAEGRVTRYADTHKGGTRVEVQLYLSDNDGNAIVGLPINAYTIKILWKVGTLATVIKPRIKEAGDGFYNFSWVTPIASPTTCTLSAEICCKVTVGHLVIRYAPKPNYNTKGKK